VHLWDTMSLNSLKTSSFSKNMPIAKAGFLEKYIFCACLDSRVLLWDATEVKSVPIRQFLGHVNEAYSVDCRAGMGKIVCGSEDGGLCVWDLNSEEMENRFQVFGRNRKR
jgi:WD40 repeat protein